MTQSDINDIKSILASFEIKYHQNIKQILHDDKLWPYYQKSTDVDLNIIKQFTETDLQKLFITEIIYKGFKPLYINSQVLELKNQIPFSIYMCLIMNSKVYNNGLAKELKYIINNFTYDDIKLIVYLHNNTQTDNQRFKIIKRIKDLIFDEQIVTMLNPYFVNSLDVDKQKAEVYHIWKLIQQNINVYSDIRQTFLNAIYPYILYGHISQKDCALLKQYFEDYLK